MTRRYNHARAACHSRSTVAREMLSASPISSSDRPPKKRSSATRLFRGSKDASSDSAASKSRRSTSCGVVGHHRFVERHPRPSPRPLRHLPPPGVINEDAAHHLRRHGEEVPAVVPLGVALVDQPKVGLMDKGGWLEDMS